MLIFSLDTTTRAGSAAVLRGDDILYEAPGDPAVTHGQRLPGEIDRALAAARVTIRAIDLFAIAAGPGSFTGLRVGIATVQGLAMAAGRRVVPVSVLDALAWAGVDGPWAVGAWVDAQRGQVFAALYDPGGRRVLAGPTSLTPAATMEAWAPLADLRTVRFIGDGAVKYAPEITARVGAATILHPPSLAGVIGRIAAADPSRALLPHAIVPIYVRRSDAELARARQEAREP
jgi:tRNA threonylcarbamoyladenosine biosynthesis protein TsaB